MDEKHHASSWSLAGVDGSPLVVSEIRTLLADRAAAGSLTTVLQSDTGLMLHLVTNRRRVMVMLMGADGSAGHAIDDGAQGTSGGYLLENGQEDEYADRDTLALPDALSAVSYTHLTLPTTPYV